MWSEEMPGSDGLATGLPSSRPGESQTRVPFPLKGQALSDHDLLGPPLTLQQCHITKENNDSISLFPSVRPSRCRGLWGRCEPGKQPGYNEVHVCGNDKQFYMQTRPDFIRNYLCRRSAIIL